MSLLNQQNFTFESIECPFEEKPFFKTCAMIHLFLQFAKMHETQVITFLQIYKILIAEV
jgi:hypothetical protein